MKKNIYSNGSINPEYYKWKEVEDSHEEVEVDSGDYDDYNDYNKERIETKEGESVIYRILIPERIFKRYEFLGDLPNGIAVMGGMARSIAREILTGEREPIRDIDLVNITDENGNSVISNEKLDELSRKFMPDDYQFGHGIGNDTLENYFSTRDFTINQCLIKDGELLISDIAQNDFIENIIRPTYYELPYDGNQISSRLFLKAIMLQSVISQISDSVPLLEDICVPNPNDSAYGDEDDGYIKVTPFNIALFLNKAMSRGAETAMIFVNSLVDWDIVNEKYIGRPMGLARDLTESVYAFEFRPSTDERFQDIPNGHDVEGFFIPEAMDKYHTSNSLIAKAIAEYYDMNDSAHQNKETEDNLIEIMRGQYTQADYDAINHA